MSILDDIRAEQNKIKEEKNKIPVLNADGGAAQKTALPTMQELTSKVVNEYSGKKSLMSAGNMAKANPYPTVDEIIKSVQNSNTGLKSAIENNKAQYKEEAKQASIPKAPEQYLVASDKSDVDKIIDEYEAIPNYNIFQRKDLNPFSNESDSFEDRQFNKKQSMQNEYEAAKNTKAQGIMAKYGITNDDLYQFSDEGRYDAGKDVLTDVERARGTMLEKTPYQEALEAKGLTEDEVEALREYNTYLNEEKVIQEKADFAKEHPILGSISTLPDQAITPLATIQEGIASLAGQPHSTHDAGQLLQSGVNASRNAVNEDMNGVERLFYNAGMSTLDQIPGLVIGGAVGKGAQALGAGARLASNLGKAASLTNAGLRAAGGAVAEGTAKGLDADQIADNALAQGITEAAFEYAPTSMALENLGGAMANAGLKTVIPRLGLQMLAEGIEEGGTDLVNAYTENKISGDKSNYNQSVDYYLSQGLSEEDAKKSALADIFKQAGESFATGALSGGMLGGGTMVAGGINVNNNNTEAPTQTDYTLLDNYNYNEYMNEMDNALNENHDLTLGNVENAERNVNLDNALARLAQEKGIAQTENVNNEEETPLENTYEQERAEYEARKHGEDEQSTSIKNHVNLSTSIRMSTSGYGIDLTDNTRYIFNQLNKFAETGDMQYLDNVRSETDYIENQLKGRTKRQGKKNSFGYTQDWFRAKVEDAISQIAKENNYIASNEQAQAVNAMYDEMDNLINNYQYKENYSDTDWEQIIGNLDDFITRYKGTEFEDNARQIAVQTAKAFENYYKGNAEDVILTRPQQLLNQTTTEENTQIAPEDIPEIPNEENQPYIPSLEEQAQLLAEAQNNYEDIPTLAQTENAPNQTENDIVPTLVQNTPQTTETSQNEGKTNVPSIIPTNTGITNTSQTATNTYKNSEFFNRTQETADELTRQIEAGTFDYEVLPNKVSLERAANELATNRQGMIDRINSDVQLGAVEQDAAMMLIDEALQKGNFDEAFRIANRARMKTTESARALQALAKYSDSAAGAITQTERMVSEKVEKYIDHHKRESKQNAKLARALMELGNDGTNVKTAETKTHADVVAEVNNTLEREGYSVYKNFTNQDRQFLAHSIENGATVEDLKYFLDKKLVTGFMGMSKADTQAVIDIYDQMQEYGPYSKERFEAETKAFEIMSKYIGDATFSEKLNEWRYFSMLGNLRTHIRNIDGNTTFGAVTEVKDNLAATIEGVVANTIAKDMERTKSVLNVASKADHQRVATAYKDADNVYKLLTDNNKYTMKNALESNRKTFNTKLIQKAVDLNSNALTAEDNFALKNKYSLVLARYLKANGVTATQYSDWVENGTNNEFVDKARAYAIKQAKIATFHEESKLADGINQFSRNMANNGTLAGTAVNMAIESALPFKKTPINIAKQGVVEYNPLQIANSLRQALSDNYTASEAIDTFSRGLTGSAIMMLGYFLASKGILRGLGKDEDKELDAQTGEQKYSLNYDGKSYTIDWTAPAALPLFVGGELYNTFNNQYTDAEDVIDAVTSLGQPIIENSMLQGLNNMISSVASNYDKTNGLATIATESATGYITQNVPTALGQIARSVDDTRRSTYSERKGLASNVDRVIQKTENKIPGLSMTNEPYIDRWGNTQENTGGSFLGRLAYNTLSPGYYSDTTKDATEQELYRLNGTTDSNVIPRSVDKTYDIDGDGEKDRLTSEQYTQISTVQGKTTKSMLDNLISTDAYKNADDTTKAEYISNVELFAKELAVKEVFGKEISNKYAKEYNIYNDKGIDGLTTFYNLKETTKDENGNRNQASVVKGLSASGLSDAEKSYYFEQFYTPSATATLAKSYGDKYLYQWYAISSSASKDSKTARNDAIALSSFSDADKQILYYINGLKDSEIKYQNNLNTLNSMFSDTKIPTLK